MARGIHSDTRMLWVFSCIIYGLAVQAVLASGSGHSGYLVSTDYTSRYHGPGASPVVLPDGTLADTPEVAAARASHLAALQKAQYLWYGKTGNSLGSSSGSYDSEGGHGKASYRYPQTTVLPSGHSGYVVSTDYTRRYHGPGTSPVVLRDGTLADTPEVAAARASHLAALQKAQALWYGSSGSSYDNYGGSTSGIYSASGRHGGYSGKRGNEGGWMTYSGPLASATVLPSGYLAESYDVAASKMAHQKVLAQAYAEASKWSTESVYNKDWKQ